MMLIEWDLEPGYARVDLGAGPSTSRAILGAWRVGDWRIVLWDGWYFRYAIILERHGLRLQLGTLIISRSFSDAWHREQFERKMARRLRP